MSMKAGIQLYSVRHAMAKDPVRAIAQVAQIGYRYIETANHNADADPGCGFGVPARQLKGAIDGYGARIISGHVFPMTEENIGPTLEYFAELGAEFLVDPMTLFEGRDEVLRRCEVYNRLGERAQRVGLSFCYHNHFHEFQKLDSQTNVLDLILEHTDPQYVGLELDTYWTLRGGKDPVQYIKDHAARIRLIHQKDLRKDYTPPLNYLDVTADKVIDRALFQSTIEPADIVEIGTGCMDIQAILDAGNGAGSIPYLILEQDQTQYDEMESVRISMEGLRRFSGIEWA